MLLNKYKIIRRLGKGSFGNVHLVEDANEEKFAVKMIDLDVLKNQPYLRSFFQGEIKCLQQINSEHMIKLVEHSQDEKYIYLVMEYCDGGDLLYHQSIQQSMVYSLQKAVQILSSVILALEELHQMGYLHRDIKSQNVLVKKQNGKQVIKLADFGLTKKKEHVNGTILGTCQYMSPQIMRGDHYGFEVDMWGFGVLFYFMLNAEPPFRFHPYWGHQRKAAQLQKMAARFSYKESVSKTKKNRVQNCTSQLQNLFKRIFQVNPEKRINFYEIRSHQVFSKMFPTPNEKSQIFYQNNRGSNLVSAPHLITQITQIQQKEQNQYTAPFSSRLLSKSTSKFQTQLKWLQSQKDKIDILKQSCQAFKSCGYILREEQKHVLCFNLLKYYIILLRKLKEKLDINNLFLQNPDLRWPEFVLTNEFTDFCTQVDQDLQRSQLSYITMFTQCQTVLDQISQISPELAMNLYYEIDVSGFVNPFREGYRKCTKYIYRVLKGKFDKRASGNKVAYLLTLLVISHAYNRLFEDPKVLREIFKQFTKDQNSFQFSKLSQWLSTSKSHALATIARAIIQRFF